MPFATRCPECRTKLRLEAAPDDGETVECPKCGTVFAPEESGGGESPAAAKPKKEKKVKKEKAAPGPGGPRKRKVKKKKTNPFFLFGMLGGAGVFVIGLAIFLYIYLGKAGKLEEMMSYVPGDCNVVRGVNTGQISKYPGFANEMDGYITPPVKACAADLAASIGFDDGDDLMDYVVIGKAKKGTRNTGVVYVYRTKKSFPKPNPLDGVASLKASDSGGATYYRSSGKGLLANAAVFTPTSRLVVVIPAGPQQQAMISAVAGGGMKNKENMFAGKSGDTGKRVSAGNMWILVRPEGPLKNYAKDMGETVKGAFPSFKKACETTPVIGWWTSYGAGGVKFGGGIECTDTTQTWEVIRSMRDGELGKQDDAELPSEFKRAVSSAGSKEFREFLAKLLFRGSGKCAYFTATMSPDNGKRYSQQIHGQGIATWNDDDNTGSVGGQGPGGLVPGGLGGGPGGRP
jgi:predicted Zn finger-like uncharacterized protein